MLWEQMQNNLFLHWLRKHSHKWIHNIIKNIETIDQLSSMVERLMPCCRFTTPTDRENFQEDLSRKCTTSVLANGLNHWTATAGMQVKLIHVASTSSAGQNCTTVCQAKFNNTGKVSMSDTHQKFKAKMKRHFGEVKRLVTLGELFFSCAKHFVTQSLNSVPC
mgnify:CR=1 FL=1